MTALFQLCRYLFAINGMEGPHIDHVRTFSWMKFETAADYEKALSRLDSLPANLQQVEALLTTSIAESRLPSVVSMVSMGKLIFKKAVVSRGIGRYSTLVRPCMDGWRVRGPPPGMFLEKSGPKSPYSIASKIPR